MSPDETKKLVYAYSQFWPSAKVDEQTAGVWHTLLHRVDAAIALKAVKYLALREEWPPSIHKIAQACKLIAAKQKRRSPEQAWAERTSSKCPAVAEAFRRWGGQTRNGAMPDPNPKWNPDWQEAQRQHDFAKRDFISIYTDLLESNDSDDAKQTIEHDTASAMLGEIRKHLEA